MFFKTQSFKLSLGLIAAAACTLVGAQTLTATGVNKYTTTNYSNNSGGSFGNGNVGALEFNYNSGSNFWAYCIDPGTGAILPGAYTTSTLDVFLNGTGTSGYASEIGRGGIYSGLSVTAASQLQVLNDLKELWGHAYSDSLTSNIKSAAFGMAAWEIIMQNGGATGTSYAVNSGSMQSHGSNTVFDADSLEAQTTAYLSALSTNNWAGISLGATTSWNYTVYFDGSAPVSQTFLQATAVSPSVVPEPGSFALAGLALLGVASARRRVAAKV
jgi:hypothetical protein